MKKKKIEKDQLQKSEFVIYMTIDYILYVGTYFKLLGTISYH